MACYQELFWLFMLGNLLGVIVEGVWCLVCYGQWETHTVTIWGNFNLVYGIGVPLFYVGSALLAKWCLVPRFLAFALLGSLVEYLCGLVIRVGVGMRAWDYRGDFLNIQGLISLKMALVWGIAGVGFQLLLARPLGSLVALLRGEGWRVACVCLSVFMAANLLWTALCIVRWSNRHHGKPARTRLTRWLDARCPDSRMEKRYYYWYFNDEPIPKAHPYRTRRARQAYQKESVS